MSHAIVSSPLYHFLIPWPEPRSGMGQRHRCPAGQFRIYGASGICVLSLWVTSYTGSCKMQSAACHSVFMRFPLMSDTYLQICDHTGLDSEICFFLVALACTE